MTEPRDVRPGTPAPSERDCERHGEVVDFSGQRVGSGPCVDRAGERLTHTAYVSPFRPNKVLRYSIAGAVVVAIGLVGIFFVAPAARPGGPGTPLRTAPAPGPTSGPHSMTTTDCAQCHRGAHNVEDARCERCHDPTISARLSNAAHVFQARGDLRVALNAPTVACVTCHVEHRGANLELTEVDDRECGSCHRVEPGALYETDDARDPSRVRDYSRRCGIGERPEMVQPCGSSQEGGRESESRYESRRRLRILPPARTESAGLRTHLVREALQDLP